MSNRYKRQRAGEFLVQEVRPISLAVQHGWPIHALIYDIARPLSRWAAETLDRVGTQRVAMIAELLRELGEKTDEVPELLAVVGILGDDFFRIRRQRAAHARE